MFIDFFDQLAVYHLNSTPKIGGKTRMYIWCSYDGLTLPEDEKKSK